jgi:hypothetical protein
MTRDHSVIEELLSVQALGGLDGDDVARLEAERAPHGDCEECDRLEAEFDETAGRLGFALDPAPVDDAMVDRILAQPQTSGIRRWQVVVGIAAAFAVLVAGVAVLGPWRSTSLNPGVTSEQQVVHFTVTPGTGGELAMAFTPGTSGAILWGRDMPDPGSGKVYEIWMITGDTPVSGGCVTPTDGTVATYLNADVGTADLMAVTRESADCPGAPTTEPIMTAPLQV